MAVAVLMWPAGLQCPGAVPRPPHSDVGSQTGPSQLVHLVGASVLRPVCCGQASVPSDSPRHSLRPAQGKLNLDGLITQPIGGNLVRAMLQQQPAKRPSIEACMHHLFWWAPAQRLALLINLSNRMETEDREVCPWLAVDG